MSDKFKAIAVKKAAASGRDPMAVTEAIARRVVADEWPMGTALPTELALASSLGVARTSVREALTRLKAKGLLASRQKAGTRVLPRVQWNMLDEDVLRWTWAGSERALMEKHLMQLRAIVEPAACEIAAAVAPDGSIAAIERAYRLMDAAGTDPVAFASRDLEFHLAILSATGNPFLNSFGAVVGAAWRMSFELSTRQPGEPRKSLPLHRAVLDQIWARDPARARQAMTALLDITECNILRALAQMQPQPSGSSRQRVSPKPPTA